MSGKRAGMEDATEAGNRNHTQVTPGTDLVFRAPLLPGMHLTSKHFLLFCLLPSFRVLGIKDIWLSFWLGTSCPSSCTVSGVGKTYI